MGDLPSILKKIKIGSAYEKAKNLGSQKIIEHIKESKLRGRGGAGFPTGLKWELTSLAQGDKVVVCNADEGEVGTFKDRHLLTDFPETLFEGMAIACLTLDAKLAIVYLRYEYSYLKNNLLKVMKQYDDAFHNIKFELRLGAGAYICGEETALLDSLEGKRGEARNKPPYPGEKGYLDQPTLINNVETFCCIPHIILDGPEKFALPGTDRSRRPKLFSVSGDVKNPGIYEFPLGTSLADILKTVGGKDAVAVLAGGASGIFIPKNEFQRKVQFNDIPPGGALIVFNKKRDLLHTLENIMDFFKEESCGQCTPCREGNHQMVKFIKKLAQNKKVYKDEYKRYLELAEVMIDASKCGLGQSSTKALLSFMHHFQKDYFKVL